MHFKKIASGMQSKKESKYQELIQSSPFTSLSKFEINMVTNIEVIRKNVFSHTRDGYWCQ